MAMFTREQKQARTRERILDAARSLILAQGFDQFSLRAVARKVDYSPAGLYEYFESKDAIIAELAMRAGVRLARLMREAVSEPEESSADSLVELGLSYIRFARNNAEDFQLLFTRLRSQRRSHQDFEDIDSPYLLLKKQVKRSITEGSITLSTTLKVDDVAYSIWSLCHGASMLQLTHLNGYQADFATIDRFALETLVGGLQSS